MLYQKSVRLTVGTYQKVRKLAFKENRQIAELIEELLLDAIKKRKEAKI